MVFYLSVSIAVIAVLFLIGWSDVRYSKRPRYRVIKRMVNVSPYNPSIRIVHRKQPMFMAQKRVMWIIWMPIDGWRNTPVEAWRDVDEYIEECDLSHTKPAFYSRDDE